MELDIFEFWICKVCLYRVKLDLITEYYLNHSIIKFEKITA